MRVAVIGSGISGLACAYALRNDAQVTLYEADSRLGGHTHTVDVSLDGIEYPVDTGFLVFNERTYPQLIALLAEATAWSDGTVGMYGMAKVVSDLVPGIGGIWLAISAVSLWLDVRR
jgi:uncharacterized protein with NAD-binding domain and iron-sulfur cluster